MGLGGTLLSISTDLIPPDPSRRLGSSATGPKPTAIVSGCDKHLIRTAMGTTERERETLYHRES